MFLDLSKTEIMCSNPAQGTDLCISRFFYVVLSCVDRGLPMGQSLVQGVLPKCLNGFIVKILNRNSSEGLIRISHNQYHVSLRRPSTIGPQLRLHTP